MPNEPTTSAAVTRRDATYVDAEGVTIHYSVWAPAQPKAVVQLAHGVGEHALRYEHVAQALAAAGYSVWADDHRGHGRTGMQQHAGVRSKLGKLGPGGLRATIEALRQFTGIIREANPSIPLVLLGHSWGSLMAQIIINDHSGDYDAAVLTGTAFRTFRHMNGGDLNARHKHLGTTGVEWLSRDVAIHHAFRADQLTFDAKIIERFGLVDALRLMGKPKRDLPHDIPVLIMVGDDDPLGGEDSAALLADAYVTRSGLSNVEALIYQGARHEIFNETNKEEVFADLVEWLDAHTATGP